MIRYFVVHNFVCNEDSYTGTMIHNYYLYEENGQLSMIPWDYNLAFGGFTGGSDATDIVNELIDTPVSDGSVSDRPMLAWIFKNEEYTELYHQYFAEFLETYATDEKLTEMIESVSEMIAPYVDKDPTKFCTYEEFETGVTALQEFCKLRFLSIQGQLDGTIASTAEGQAQDRDSLIDASSVSIEDMGSMNIGGGFGQKRDPGGMSVPENVEAPNGMKLPDRMKIPDGMDPPDGMEIPNGMDPPDRMEAQNRMEP